MVREAPATSQRRLATGDRQAGLVGHVLLAVIVNLIGATRTAAGLRVRCELDRGPYPKGQDVSDTQMAAVKLVPHTFHGDWKYTLHPIRRRR